MKTIILRDAYVIFVESIEHMPLHDNPRKRNSDIENRFRDAIKIVAHDHRLSLKDFDLPELRGVA